MESNIPQTDNLELVEKNSDKKTNIALILGIIFISFIIIIFLVFLGVTAYISSTNKIISGIKINGIDVSGLTQNEAIAKVTEEFNKTLPTNATVVHGEYETQLGLNDMGVNFNVNGLVEEAFNQGRDENVFSNMFTILRNMVSTKNIGLDVSINNEQTTNLLNDISTKLPDTVVQSSYYIDGNNLIITSGKTGMVVDTEKTIQEIKNNIDNLTYANKKIELITVSKDPDSIDIDKIHNEIYKEPVDAYYTTNPYVVYPHENGVDFKITVDEAKAMVAEPKEEYKIPLKYTSPNVTTNMIGTEAFPDLLAKYSTKYSSSNKDRTTNLRLAAEKINGTVVMPGEIFSYNTVVGERTIEAGYKEAAMYVNGEVVDGLGGGICQISTTLYNAVLYSNLEIVERKNHRFVPTYSDAGRDATVVYGAIDFRFKNTRNYPIKIMFSVSGGVAKCEIFGLKENPDYEVEISSKVTERTSTTIKSVTYKTVKQNGQVISSGIINRDTYKRH